MRTHPTASPPRPSTPSLFLGQDVLAPLHPVRITTSSRAPTDLMLTLIPSAAFTSFIDVAMATVTSRLYANATNDGYGIGYNDVDLFARLFSGATVIAHLFNLLAEVTIFLTLASMIRCIRIAESAEDKHPTRHKFSRYLAYAISFVITVFCLASFSISLYAIVLSGISTSYTGIAWDKYYDGTDTAGVVMDYLCQGLLCAISIAMLVRAIMLRRKLHASKTLRKPLVYLTACCSLWVLRAVFDIYVIIFEAKYLSYFEQSLDIMSSFNEVLSVVFMTWPVFIILVILYYLGLDTKTGLSSAGRPLLMGDAESQAASSEFLSPDQPNVTPMTERNNASLLTPISPITTERNSVSLTTPTVATTENINNNALAPSSSQPTGHMFEWDGLSDAPPEYSPPATRAIVLPSVVPRRPVPGLAVQPVPAAQVEAASPDSTNAQAESGQPLVPAQSLTTAQPNNNNTVATTTQQQQTRTLRAYPTLPEPTEEELDALPTHDEAMGLYHQADGRQPGSSGAVPLHNETTGLHHQADGRPPAPSISGPLPPHDEAIGLYHQADGRSPAEASMAGPLPSHDEAMGLYHQADGRSPAGASMAGPLPSHDEAMGLYHQADGRVPLSEVIPFQAHEKEKEKAKKY